MNSISRFSLILLWVFFLACAPRAGLKEIVTPEQIQARLELAERYLVEGKARLALQQLLLIKPESKDNPRLYFDLGLTYMALGEEQKAEQAYLKTIQLDQNYAEAWNNLGQVYMVRGDYGQAEQAFKKALSTLTYLTPEFAAYNLAQLYLKQQQVDLAHKYAKLSIEKNWRYIPGYILAAKLYLQKGQLIEAVNLLKQGVEANPVNTQIILNLAEYLVRTGENEQAKKYFKQILELDPSCKEAQVARDYLDFIQ
ncbi:tetratricopeptide repeat protein [Desulfovulcanus sp.]